MTRLISFAEIRSLGFNEKQIKDAISLQVWRGCHALNCRTRFNSAFKSFRWVCGCTHTFPPEKLGDLDDFNDANMFEGPKFTDKVSMILGYENVNELSEQESRGQTESNTCFFHGFNLALACEKFSSIALSGSQQIELYNGASQTDGMSVSVDFSKHIDRWSSITSTVNEIPDSSKMKSSADEPDLHSVSRNDHLKSPGGMATAISSASEQTLDRSIRCLPGLTNRVYCLLENGGFHTVRKLLQHFPRTYADLRNVHDSIEDGQFLILVGTIKSSRAVTVGSSLSVLEVIVVCELEKCERELDRKKGACSTGDLKLIYVHLKRFFRGTRFLSRQFLHRIQSRYNEGDCVYITGKVKKMRAEAHYEMKDYSVDIVEEEEADFRIEPRPFPLYPSKVGLKPCFLRDIILSALKFVPEIGDPLPEDILKEFSLLNLHDTYHGIHCPQNISEADAARRRVIFDEFFYLQLARLFQMLEGCGTWTEKDELLEKYMKETSNKTSMERWSVLTKTFLKSLPYSLTTSQLNAVSEIIWDLKEPVPMNRLLQGEVGSGKTIVAFLACMEVMASGFQAAFMVPTELLAIQHYELLLSYLDNMGEDQQKPSIALLTGSTSAKQSRVVRQGLLNGDISMVIGTHSLIAEKIDFCALRIAVIDEQHRFGVVQRGRFNSKLYSGLTNSSAVDSGKMSSTEGQMAPHVLAMSATPIPRSLALAIYGDVSLTQIMGSLPGRVSVETNAFEGNENGLEKVYQMMRDELTDGGKVYLVYPIIDESEQLPQLRAAANELELISAKFEDYQCGLLHGRMNYDDKLEALRQFRSGNTKILLSTQVIEIGIDIPDASMIVVMNAERFGIAQLHQLRGRVGRGSKKSRCIFLSSTASALDRLKVLETSSDGFYLAKVDLMFRGPGDLLGKKQSGHLPEFPIARLEIDGNVLQDAHMAALKILSSSKDLEKFPKLKVELSIRQPLCLLGD